MLTTTMTTMKEDEKMNKGDDMITSDYLLWLEQTAKSAGFDPNAARDHFNKGYGPGESSHLICADRGRLKVLAKTTPASDHSQTLAPRLPATRMSSRATISTRECFAVRD